MNIANLKNRSPWLMLSLLLLGTTNAASADSSLIALVREQDKTAVQQLIAQNVDVNAPQLDGATALHWAAHLDDLDLAKMLLDAGADVTAKNLYGVMPLALAIENGSAPLVDVLLQAGAYANALAGTGETPLMTAAYIGNLEVVDLLLKRGAYVKAKEPVRRQTALMWAVGESHSDVARRLVEHGADIHARTTFGFTPLLFAAREGDLESARLFLDEGADPNTKMYATDEKIDTIMARVQDRTELSALHIAVQRGKGDLATLLLERGADPNDDTPGWAPLHWATGTFNTEMDGANGIRAPRDHEWGSLHGVSIGKFEMVKTLLDHGANPNARLKRSPSRHGFTVIPVATGITPLGLAAFAGEADIIRLLVDRGADISIKADNGRTPLLFAAGIYRRRAEKAVSNEALMSAVVALVELGAKATEHDGGKTTALHGAAWIRSTEMVQYLVDHGADVFAKNSNGLTALDIADRSGISFGEENADQERLPVGHLLHELSVPKEVKRSLKEWGALSPDLRETIESILQDESERLKKEQLAQRELQKRRAKERAERKRKEELANKDSQDLR